MRGCGRDLPDRMPLIQSLPGTDRFWGQNFGVLTGHLEKGWPAFLILGVGLSAACVTATVVLLGRRNWD